MMMLSWWKRSMVVMAVVTTGAVGLAFHPRRGDSAEPPAQADGEAKNQYRGSVRCQTCHSNGITKDYGYAKGFVRLEEYKTWDEVDKHSLAYKNLLGDRGKRMGERLNVVVTDKKAGCIGCHGASEVEASERFPGDLLNPLEGVSCENCHGPSSKWWLTHADPSFRKTSFADREKIGLYDLRSPARQAEQCFSCHIGKASDNPSDGKVVTHEMYAAGHPPLPSIELATFGDAIPRHWWLPSEKTTEDGRKAAGFQAGQKERTKLALVGAAVALRTSMTLLADETKATGTAAVPGLDWPDYARFDCWSCHHDLKRESWRQARGFKASPGRPSISEWPLAMVELGIDRVEMDNPAAAGALRAELIGHQKGVLGEANAKPFGKAVPLAKAASEFAKWSEVLIETLTKASYDEAVSLGLLRKLVANAREKVADYDEARQIAWTIKILAADAGLLAADAGLKSPNRVKIAAILAKFDEGLKLVLPTGQKVKIEDQLKKALEVIGGYEPSDFRAQLAELAALIPPEPK